MTNVIPFPIPDRLPGEAPEQRILRLARSDPEFRDRLAANTFAYHRGLRWPNGHWERLPEAERGAWRERLLRELEGEAGEARPDIEPAPTTCPRCGGENPLALHRFCDACMDAQARTLADWPA